MGTLYGPNDARIYDALGNWGVGTHTLSAIRTIANTPNGLVILGEWFLDILELLERMEEEYIEEPYNYCFASNTLQSVINRVAKNGGDWTR